MNIPLSQILQAIRDANIDLPAGSIERGNYDVTLRAPAEFTDLDQIRDTVVATHEGAAVTLARLQRSRIPMKINPNDSREW